MPKIIVDNGDDTVTTTTTRTRTIDLKPLRKELRVLDRAIKRGFTKKEILAFGEAAAEHELVALEVEAESLRYQIAELTP